MAEGECGAYGEIVLPRDGLANRTGGFVTLLGGLYAANGDLNRRVHQRRGKHKLIKAQSIAVRHRPERIQHCADPMRHIIVTGESDVGKEHVAHLLWERSPTRLGTARQL